MTTQPTPRFTVERELDHDGNCQRHWGENPCSVGVALDLLASPAVQALPATTEGGES